VASGQCPTHGLERRMQRVLLLRAAPGGTLLNPTFPEVPLSLRRCLRMQHQVSPPHGQCTGAVHRGSAQGQCTGAVLCSFLALAG
jgi:hypothetical protein